MTNDELAVLLRKTILSVLLEEVVGWETRPVLEQLRLVLDVRGSRGALRDPARSLSWYGSRFGSTTWSTDMAESTVKAVSPVITLTMDLEEATALRELLATTYADRHQLRSGTWKLSSVQSAVSEGVRNAEAIVAGGVDTVVKF